MNKLFKSLSCAGLMTVASVSTVDAAIVNLDFSNAAGGSVSYVIDVQTDAGFGSFMQLTSATINGVTYDSSNAILDLAGLEVTNFNVLDFSTEAKISSLTFNGYFFVDAAGVFSTDYYGGAIYSGSSYSFDSPVDSFTGLSSAMLYDQAGGLEMTSLSVTTVSAVPVPAAVWLFGSGLLGLAGVARRRV